MEINMSIKKMTINTTFPAAGKEFTFPVVKIIPMHSNSASPILKIL